LNRIAINLPLQPFLAATFDIALFYHGYSGWYPEYNTEVKMFLRGIFANEWLSREPHVCTIICKHIYTENDKLSNFEDIFISFDTTLLNKRLFYLTRVGVTIIHHYNL